MTENDVEIIRSLSRYIRAQAVYGEADSEEFNLTEDDAQFGLRETFKRIIHSSQQIVDML